MEVRGEVKRQAEMYFHLVITCTTEEDNNLLDAMDIYKSFHLLRPDWMGHSRPTRELQELSDSSFMHVLWLLQVDSAQLTSLLASIFNLEIKVLDKLVA